MYVFFYQLMKEIDLIDCKGEEKSSFLNNVYINEIRIL